MSGELTFMMGEFEARFPTDRDYARNHMWARRGPDTDTIRFGFSAYAVRLLQDVYFLDWIVQPPAELRERQEIGAVESKKAESDLFAPMGGRLECFNDALLRDPSTINIDTYDRGWLFEMQGRGAELLSCRDYIAFLGEVWEVTQRTIKGQLNE